MTDFSRDDDGTQPMFSRRSILKSAAAAGLSATAVAALSSILPMRAFAQGAPSGAVVYGNAEPPTSN